MAPPKKTSAAAASAAPFAGEMDDADDSINWLQNPSSGSSTTGSSCSDPALPPLLSQLAALDAHLTCPICHATPFQIPVTLRNCSHAFCSLCLQSNLRHQAMAKNGTATGQRCPACRTRCEERDVRGNPTLEAVCRLWGGVRGPVRDRMWRSCSSSSSSSSSGGGGGGGGGGNNDEKDAKDESAATANGSRDASADGAEDGGGGTKRAAASVAASASSSSSPAGGSRKRPRRSSSRRASASTSASTATAAAAAAGSTDDDDESPPSSEEDSGEEYAEEDGEGGGGNSDTDVELVPKSGGGGGRGGGRGGGSGARRAPARSSSASAATGKAAAAAAAAAAAHAAAKSYPSDAEYLTAHGSTIDLPSLDRSRPIAGSIGLLRRPQLIKLLESYNLSTSTRQGGSGNGSGNGKGGGGGLDVLKDRYRAFRMLYNAQCPSTRPAPIARLVEQVHAEERARDRERRVAVLNGGGRVAEEMRRLNAKWNEEKADGGTGGGDATARAGSSRAADIPDKMKSGFAALLAEGRKRCKEQGWRMGEEDAGAGNGMGKERKWKWEEDKQEMGGEEEKKDDAADDGAEEPIVLDDGSDEDDDGDRKPSAAEAAKAAEDGIDEPRDTTNVAIATNGDDEAQISRSPSSESPRTVRASSSSDGLVGSASAASASGPAKMSSSARKAKESKPSPQRTYHQTPQPQQYQPASVDTRSIRNNSTPSTIGPWSCGACTFYNEINIGSRDKCEVCETPRPRLSSRPMRNVASFDC